LELNNENFLIIGGAPKAGTTSLYKYLFDHPDVCASSIKETRFFLDQAYPVKSSVRFNGHNLDAYQKFFQPEGAKGPQLFVEATPDYLYSKAALQVAELLPRAKMVFILRDPVERMVSWYKYALQRNMIAETMSFKDYVDLQLKQSVEADTPVYLRALDQCRYDYYLEGFQDRFQERLLIIDFESLKQNPLKVMQTICDFSGLSADFFDDYQFRQENASQSPQSWVYTRYLAFRREVAYLLHEHPKIIRWLRKPNRAIKRMLSKNTKQADTVVVSQVLREEIVKYLKHK